MKKVGTALMAILILSSVLIAPVVYAKKYQVTVKVIDSSDKGKERKLVDAIVVLTQGDVHIEDMLTDEKGKAVFKDLKPDTKYTVTYTELDGTVHSETFTTNKNGAAPLQTIDIG